MLDLTISLRSVFPSFVNLMSPAPPTSLKVKEGKIDKNILSLCATSAIWVLTKTELVQYAADFGYLIVLKY